MDAYQSRSSVAPGTGSSRVQTDLKGKAPRDSVVFSVPHQVRVVKDLLWTAVISIILACAAAVSGAIDIFTDADLVPFTQGAGLASITFGLAGLAEKFDPAARRGKSKADRLN